MSRSGYIDDYDSDNLAVYRWRGQVASAIRGRRGQAFLRELKEALEAMPVKELISRDLEREGQVCALGAVGVKRGIDLTVFDPEDAHPLAEAFGIAHQLVREVEYINDECVHPPNPAIRWRSVYNWVLRNLKEPTL